MNEIQKRLFEMLQELVAICEEHDITYYAAGGTVLGAVRHKGFIPWDDDIDLMMPRKDWERFVAISQEGLPDGRALACLELDENYPHVFGRYVDTATTAIHYNQLLGNGVGGLVIDIFILDCVPNARDAYASHCEKLSLFNDLANDIGYSYPMSSNKYRLQQYAKRIAKEGRRAVLDELAAELARYEDGEYMVMRWAAAPRLFHESLFAYPRWEEFEGLRIRVPGKCADYLVQHYGDDWMYVPASEGRVTHDAIMFTDIDYATFQADYLPFIDIERARKAIFRRKNYHITHMHELHEAEDIEARICAEFARLVTLDRVKACGIDAAMSYSDTVNCDLDWVFAEFYRWQGSVTLEGREEYLHIRRYHDPVLVDIGDGLLRLAVLNLLKKNRVGLAHRLLRVREITKGSIEGEALDARKWIDLVRMPASLLDVGCADEALALSDELLVKVPGLFSNRVLLAEMLYRRRDFGKLEAVASVGRELHPEAGEFAKYLVDCAFERATLADDMRAAFDSYSEALGHTTNGFLIADVLEKAQRCSEIHGLDVVCKVQKAASNAKQAVPDAAVHRYDTNGIGEKTPALLAELADICGELGIECFLGPESGRLALRYGCNEPGLPVLDMLVPAKDLPRFTQAVIKRRRKNRAVDCWLTNKSFRSFEVHYVDTSTTFMQLDEGWNIGAHGVKVVVMPLREVGAGVRTAFLDLVEEGWAINGYKLTKKITAQHALAAGIARVGMVLGRRRLAKCIFKELSAIPCLTAKVSVRLSDREPVVFDRIQFEGGEPVRFCNREYKMPHDAEEVLARFFGSDWATDPIEVDVKGVLVSATVPYGELLARLSEQDCALERLFFLMRKIRVGMLPLVNDLRIRNRAMLQARLSGDRKRWYAYLSQREDKINRLIRNNDVEGIERLFSGYKADALRYLRQGLCLCPCERYLAVLCVILHEGGEGDKADKLMKLAARRHLAPLVDKGW